MKDLKAGRPTSQQGESWAAQPGAQLSWLNLCVQSLRPHFPASLSLRVLGNKESSWDWWTKRDKWTPSYRCLFQTCDVRPGKLAGSDASLSSTDLLGLRFFGLVTFSLSLSFSPSPSLSPLPPSLCYTHTHKWPRHTCTETATKLCNYYLLFSDPNLPYSLTSPVILQKRERKNIKTKTYLQDPPQVPLAEEEHSWYPTRIWGVPGNKAPCCSGPRGGHPPTAWGLGEEGCFSPCSPPRLFPGCWEGN